MTDNQRADEAAHLREILLGIRSKLTQVGVTGSTLEAQVDEALSRLKRLDEAERELTLLKAQTSEHGG